MNSDYVFKPEGGWSAHYWPFIFDFKYTKLRHHPIKIDFSKMHFDYTTLPDMTPVLFVELPMIEDLRFEMDYSGRFGLLPFKGQLAIEIEESYALITTALKATSQGLLYPVLHDVYADFGLSNVYCDNRIKQFFLR